MGRYKTMTGTVIVTGCATGLGLHVAQRLLSLPLPTLHYTFIFTVRSHNSSPTKKLENLVAKFNSKTRKARAEIRTIDLDDMDSIRLFAADINTAVANGSIPEIRALILNAGYQARFEDRPYSPPASKGVETHFMINYLANFLLSLLLLQSIMSNGRIVYVSSWSHDSAHRVTKLDKPDAIRWRDDKCETIALVSKWPVGIDEGRPGGAERYGASKLWLVMGMSFLQGRLQASRKFKDIAVVGVDPGGNPGTSIARRASLINHVVLFILRLYVVLFARFVWPNGLWRTNDKTAQDITWAALLTKPGGMDPKGLYFNGSEVGEVADEAKDVEKQKKLWKASIKLADIQQSETVLKL